VLDNQKKNEQTKILVADDHPLMRNGIKSVLEFEPSFKVVCEAKDGEEAIKLLSEKNFDIVTLDVEMPKINGLEIARRMIKERIATKIIFLTMHKDEDMFNQALDIGAMGYVLKENAIDDIVECVKMVTKGRYYISPTISQYLMNREKRIKDLADSAPSINNLTKTERIILRLIADDKTTRQIADELHVSYKTVENHRNNISKKLNLQGSHSLIKFAINNKAIL
jgi:DNA-binding NarL/FixJ family response regulator